MQSTVNALTRRNLVQIGAAFIVAPIVGCSSKSEDADAGQSQGIQPRAQVAATRAMTIHKDPGCACCTAWADLARKAGYQITVTEDPDMPSYKRKLGVPEQLWSCHTANVSGYALEGHVPLEDVARLLANRDSAIAGLAVAGLPRGSPGMEMPDGSADPFQVTAFRRSGPSSIFSTRQVEG